MRLRASLLAVTFALAGPASARAECVGHDFHRYFAFASTVFLADVRDVIGPHVVFDIREAFKNARRGRARLPVEWSIEGHHFRPGQRVLVMGWRNKGLLSTFCSGTRVVSDGDPVIAIVRHLARRDAGGTVEGVLSRFDFNWLNYSGIRISLRPVFGSGPVLSTVTGPGHGGFRFEWVPPGRYAVTLEGPPGVKDQQRLIYVGVEQVHLRVPAFIISADEHPLIADPLD